MRKGLRTYLTCVAAMLCVAVVAPQGAGAASVCPNEETRGGASARLLRLPCV